MCHEPSGQYKVDSTYRRSLLKIYTAISIEQQACRANCRLLALLIAAFLRPKFMQADNGKELKGALLILLR